MRPHGTPLATLAATVLALWLGFAVGLPSALACSYEAPTPHTLDPAEVGVDTSPPSAVENLRVVVKRGGPSGCGSATSCDDIGSLQVRFDPAEDDRTNAAEMGYQLTATGRLPDGLVLPSEPVRIPNGELFLHWVDGQDSKQDAFRLDLTVTPVDLAGNDGDATAPFTVADDGGQGCSVAARRTGQDWGALVVVALFLRRGARRSRAGRAR